MARYSYEELKDISRRIRAGLASEGIVLEKRARRKPRDEEKKRLILEMAMNRLKSNPPRKTSKGIILPYYRI